MPIAFWMVKNRITRERYGEQANMKEETKQNPELKDWFDG